MITKPISITGPNFIHLSSETAGSTDQKTLEKPRLQITNSGTILRQEKCGITLEEMLWENICTRANKAGIKAKARGYSIIIIEKTAPKAKAIDILEL